MAGEIICSCLSCECDREAYVPGFPCKDCASGNHNRFQSKRHAELTAQTLCEHTGKIHAAIMTLKTAIQFAQDYGLPTVRFEDRVRLLEDEWLTLTQINSRMSGVIEKMTD